MKLFLKILAGFFILFIIALVALNFYFTDERLKHMILPEVREATGSELNVETMSITFFRTFPQFGVELGNVVLPDRVGEPVASIEELLVGVELLPLMRDEISISRLSMNRPAIHYTVYSDSTTNIDFLMDLTSEEEEVEEEGEGYALAIPRFTIRSAEIYYRDETSNTSVQLQDFDADISLNFAELIESTVQAELGSLSASVEGENYLENLSLSLNQTSTVDLENEVLTLTEGTFSIRGLALNLAGTVSSWSSEAPVLDLQFSSSSDNFGELLGLAPPEFDDVLAGLETRGALALDGSVSGEIAEETIPRFDLSVMVEDGYLKNPDLPDAIEDISLRLTVNNELATIEEFNARADENTISASGSLERPLDEDGVFSLDFDGDVDLATISRFYPIEELGIEQLSGLLNANASAGGRIDQPEEATFSGDFVLSNGLLKYVDVPRPVEQINARIEASQDQVIIEESGFSAAQNRFSMSGTVYRPLDEDQRSVDVTANLNFDLATIKEFYPIDEDTLTMRGQLDAQVVLQGRADPDQIESLLQQSTFSLSNGYIAHQMVARPLEDITLTAEASGTRLSISEARFRTGNNALSMQGTVSDYLSEDPTFDLTFDGNAEFSDISAYYSLEPWIQELTGDAVMNLNARGPAGDPLQIALNGSLELNGVNARGDSIPQPVTDLQGSLNVTPNALTLESFSMNYGSSDISLEGSLQRYLAFLEETGSTESMPSITGSYHSRLLNMDEMIDWEEETEDEPIPIDLPNLTASVDAQIDSLVIMGLSVTDISGSSRVTPGRILLENANASMFEGTANGRLDWQVPDPLRTNMRFEGGLNELEAEAFFRDAMFLGESNFYEYISGAFSTEITYYSELDETLSPDETTIEANGSFGMTRARIQNHPIQVKVAEWLRTNQLTSLALDEWTATFTIRDAVMTLRDFNLTSDNIGVELEGTQHLVTDEINYRATIFLPEQFKSGIASVISNRAADALQQEDGRMAVPVLITGTSENPQIRPDDDIIQDIIRDFLRDEAGGIIRNLFGN
ncbi:MAG: AsmA-like C-terminal region-containing protein [Balneolaceae bacterium]